MVFQLAEIAKALDFCIDGCFTFVLEIQKEKDEVG
jgi:hypothetical protein